LVEVGGLSLLTLLKLLTRLPDNHVLLKRQLTLNVLQSQLFFLWYGSFCIINGIYFKMSGI